MSRSIQFASHAIAVICLLISPIADLQEFSGKGGVPTPPIDDPRPSGPTGGSGRWAVLDQEKFPVSA